MAEEGSWPLSYRVRARSDTASANAMYRLLISMLLVTAVAVGAPQEPNKSEETYVKIQPVNETTFQNLSPDVPSPVSPLEGNDLDRYTVSDDVTTDQQLEATTEAVKAATETDVRTDEALVFVEEIKTRTKPPSPRFFSKLSYFQKPNYSSGLSPTNILERNGKRKFKSRCRCEKIWNCPKLQITVPRCPDEYFLCCF